MDDVDNEPLHVPDLETPIVGVGCSVRLSLWVLSGVFCLMLTHVGVLLQLIFFSLCFLHFTAHFNML